MADNLPDHIPSLDLADFRSGDPARKAKFVKELGDAYQSIGNINIPIIVRLQGTNADVAKKLIDDSGLKVQSAILLSEAADLVGKAVA